MFSPKHFSYKIRVKSLLMLLSQQMERISYGKGFEEMLLKVKISPQNRKQ